jgi:hypothetical protein
MRRFGVPDDDMPDNLPPPGWGPASSDERDLDAVLAGQMADIPIALRPVADVLAALRAAPAPAELRGEANAMAEFRAYGPAGVAHPMGPAPTRPLSVLSEDPSPRRRPKGRRGRRKAGRPVSLWAGTLTGVATAAAIVIVVAFTGNLPAPIERLAHLGPTSTPSAKASSSHSVAPKTETSSASVQPTTASPSATHSTGPTQSGPSAICDEYYGDFKHPDPPSRLATEMSLWQQLTAMAHSPSPVQVYRFCEPWVGSLFPRWTPELNPYPATPHANAGNQGNNQSASPDNPAASDSPAVSNNSGGPNSSSNQNGGADQNGVPPGQEPASSAGPMH